MQVLCGILQQMKRNILPDGLIILIPKNYDCLKEILYICNVLGNKSLKEPRFEALFLF